MRLRQLVLAAGIGFGGCTSPTHSAPAEPTGMVSAADPRAAAAGVEVLREGGTAADAAFATLLALNVVEPQSSGIGGGGYLVYSDKGGPAVTFDGREKAPAAANGTWFYKNGQPMEFSDAQPGGKSVGVPGNLRMIALAHEKYGKLPWAELFQPAITLAREGFPVSNRLAKMIAERDPQSFTPEARAYLFDAQGRPLPAGYKLTNPALAETLELIAREGPNAFYQGDIARDIAAAVQHVPRKPGSLTSGDLAAYRPLPREPICSDYRAHKVCGMGPSSSGGVAVAQVLGIVEPFHLGPAPLGARAAHFIVEAERLALADRERYLADPDFVAVPVAGLLDPGYLAERRALINPDRAMDKVSAGTPPNIKQGEFGDDRTEELPGTSQISIVDDAGNAFSFTTSIEYAFGARSMVRGFLLNNQLTDFSFEPKDAEGRPVANRVEPGKRPRSAMDPTMVFASDGGLRFVLGSPGGPLIIPFNVKTIIALIDWGLDPAQAAALVNIAGLETALLLEPGTEWNALAASLDAMGHAVRRVPMTSGEHIIAVTPHGLEGGADPRRDGVALGD
jgi:gamma-glutamyltranspeptidase/glutathione hydrolase